MNEVSPKIRDRSLDLFKGFLILQMTFAHVIAFYGDASDEWYWASQMINLSTFGGFLFAFAWGAELAWLKKDWKTASSRLLKAAGRLHVSFILSGFCYTLIVCDGIWAWDDFWRMATFRAIPNYGQFLGSFTLVTLGTWLLFPLWKKINVFWALFLASLCVLSTLIHPFHERIFWAYLWEPKTLGTFPVFQYGHYWLVGLVAARKKWLGPWFLLPFALIGSTLIGYYIYQNEEMPLEYGPSIWWIMGGYGIHWIYLQLSRLLNRFNLADWLSEIGAKALYFLLGTNLLIFSLRGHMDTGHDLIEGLGITAGILAALYWAAYLVKRG